MRSAHSRLPTHCACVPLIGMRSEDIFHLAGNARRLPNICRLVFGVYVGGARDADLDRIVDRVGQQLPCIHARAGDGRGEHRLQFLNELRSDLFILDLDQHLRVVQLLQLRGGGKPEPRTASADKSRDVAQYVAGMIASAGVPVENCSACSRTICSTLRAVWLVASSVGIVGQPDIDI